MVEVDQETIPLSRLVLSFAFLGVVALLGILLWQRGETITFLFALFSMENILRNLAIGVLVGGLATILMLFLVKGTRTRLPMNPYTKQLKEIMLRPYGALIVGVLPGIFEEILFRGFLLSLGIDLLGTMWAVFVTSVIFCVLHIPQYRNIWLINVYVLLLAVVLSYLFVATQSLWAPIMAHTVYNYCVTVLTQKGIFTFEEE